MDISGATRAAADEALATSAARRRARFLMFHLDLLLVGGGVSLLLSCVSGTMFNWATDSPGLPATVSRLPMVFLL